ncbi:hypothetical protein MTR67_046548 [Solanum verrucosum]|uniref:Uncharacterized protein n=1 Tax=Solanum verrucosum TaxID=315347 RepID=A0AAF0ZXB7_SOLVR|nr:hypothetical protein MTR67_046548 [Solanum verrucosum]
MRLDINEVYRSRGKNDARCYPNNIEWISSSFSWLVNDAVRWMPHRCQCVTFHSLKNFRTAISTCQCASLGHVKGVLQMS